MKEGIFPLNELYPEISSAWEDQDHPNGFVVHYHWHPLNEFGGIDVEHADPFTKEWFNALHDYKTGIIHFRGKVFTFGWSWDSGPNSDDKEHEVVNQQSGHQAHTIIVFERSSVTTENVAKPHS